MSKKTWSGLEHMSAGVSLWDSHVQKNLTESGHLLLLLVTLASFSPCDPCLAIRKSNETFVQQPHPSPHAQCQVTMTINLVQSHARTGVAPRGQGQG